MNTFLEIEWTEIVVISRRVDCFKDMYTQVVDIWLFLGWVDGFTLQLFLDPNVYIRLEKLILT